MSHIIQKAKLNHNVWITGAPGIGFNTVGELLKGFMTDNIGYRTDHKLPRQWFVSIPVLKYKMTEPNDTQRYYYGYAQNFMDIAALPWKHIFVLTAPDEVLTERVLRYRKEEKINDSRPHQEAVTSLINVQKQLLKAFNNAEVKYINIPADALPKAIASVIKTETENG